jgi:hypothetical protein
MSVYGKTKLTLQLEPARLEGVCDRGHWFELKERVMRFCCLNDVNFVEEHDRVTVETYDHQEARHICSLTERS